MSSATGLNSTKATFLRWPVRVTRGWSMLYVGPPSGNSHNYTLTEMRRSNHNSKICWRANDLLIIKRIKIEITWITSTYHYNKHPSLVSREKRKLGGHPSRCIVRTDQDWTTTSGCRKGKVFGISFYVSLISSRRCNSESLINLFSYNSRYWSTDTLETRTIDVSELWSRCIVHETNKECVDMSKICSSYLDVKLGIPTNKSHTITIKSFLLCCENILLLSRMFLLYSIPNRYSTSLVEFSPTRFSFSVWFSTGCSFSGSWDTI